MTIEMKGFNKAYNNMLKIEAKEKAIKEYLAARVEAAVKEGVERKVAKVMIKTMYDAGLIQFPECGFVEA